MCEMNMQAAITRRALAAALLFVASWRAVALEVDVTALLKRSDQARGGGLDGLVWDVAATSTGAGEDQDMRLRIKAKDGASLAETLEPLKSKGAKMLQIDRNMWLTKPGLRKPIPISVRQRLSGLAAIGDVAATNYVRDYKGALLREEVFNGEHCWVLELAAADKQATYDKLHYWIASASGLGKHAEFLSLSGKRLKSADFVYDNVIDVGGKRLPFVSQMTIADELTAARTTLTYGNVKVQTLAASVFDINHLE